MALRTTDDWSQFFQVCDIPLDEAKTYAEAFVKNRITETRLSGLTESSLTTLGVTVLGDVVAILQHAKSSIPPSRPSTCTIVKPPSAKLPEITSDMTLPQLRKFRIDWDVFKRITQISNTQIHAHIYSCCDDTVQSALVNTISDIFDVSEVELLTAIENLVTKRSNPSVHRMNFSSIIQTAEERAYRTSSYVSSQLRLIVNSHVHHAMLTYTLFT